MVTEKKNLANLSRRFFLEKSSQIILGLGTIGLPSICDAKVPGKRSLSFFHTRTQKRLNVTYAVGKSYNRRALTEVNSFLRDWQTNQVHVIDPRLLDILWSIQQEVGCKGVYEVVSGYRSPTTNRKLRRSHSGVAGQSLHMLGKAIDIRFSGCNIRNIRQCALAMKTGGVGYYAQADFIHLDSGEFRTW